MVVSLTGMFPKYLTALEGGESVESAELLALALYMEGRDEVVDTL